MSNERHDEKRLSLIKFLVRLKPKIVRVQVGQL